jgi:hypothetical protein
MIVYNVTNKILPAIESEWLAWLKVEHIPDIMASGQFTEFKLYRLLDDNEMDGATYITQYFSLTKENYERYIQENAPLLRQKAFDKWGNQFIAFRTIMEVVN